MNAMRIFKSLLVIGALAAWGCQPETSVDPNVEQLGRATGPVAGNPAPKAMTPPPAVTAATHDGEVAEVINVPRYTYLRLKSDGKSETWAAVPSAEIKIGAKVTIQEQMVQKSFKSPSLDRTFETLIFGTLEGGAAPEQVEGALPAGHPAVEGIGTQPAPKELPSGHPPIEAMQQKGEKPAGAAPTI